MISIYRACILSFCFVLPVQAMPEVVQWQTPKGAQVLYAYAPELPMVDARLVFDAGSARDGQQAGIAYLTNQLIGLGDAQRDEEAFAEQSEALGMQFSTQSFKDMAVINFRSLSRSNVLQPAIELAATAIAQPQFDAQVLKRQQAQLLTALQAKQQSPSALAADAFWQQLYGQHPYAHPSEGNAHSISALTTDDLRQFYQHYYNAANAVIAIVGDISRADAEQMAIRLVDGLSQGNHAPALPAVIAPSQAVMQEIDYPSAQTQLLLGQVGVDRQDPDYVPLYIANHILGGSGFASRLMHEVREKRGLVYGVSSSLLPMAQPGPWYISLQTATNNAPEALSVVKQTLNGLLSTISDDELQTHKDNIIGSFALEVDSNKDIVSYLAMIGFYHLPISWLTHFPEQVAQVTKDQLMTAIKHHLTPKTWVGVRLGKPADAHAAVVTIPSVPSGGHH